MSNLFHFFPCVMECKVMELSSAIVCAISCPIRPNSFSDLPAGGGKWEKFGKAKFLGFVSMLIFINIWSKRNILPSNKVELTPLCLLFCYIFLTPVIFDRTSGLRASLM